MTRCNTLDAWFNEQSKKIDKAEKETKKELSLEIKLRK